MFLPKVRIFSPSPHIYPPAYPLFHTLTIVRPQDAAPRSLPCCSLAAADLAGEPSSSSLLIPAAARASRGHPALDRMADDAWVLSLAAWEEAVAFLGDP